MSLFHWLVVIAVVMVLFGGRGKISDLMGDVAKGIKSFKKGMSDEDSQTSAAVQPVKAIDGQGGIAVGDTQHTKAG